MEDVLQAAGVVSALMIIVPITPDNYEQVANIYQAGLDTGYASFEVKAKTWSVWDASHHPHSRIAMIIDNKIVGWAALSPVSSRAVYAGVAEVSIYIHPNHHGIGIGTQLLHRLIESSEQEMIWTLQSSIFRENNGSIALHLKCGFRQIGYREKVAQRNGVWYDNVLFERRSPLI